MPVVLLLVAWWQRGRVERGDVLRTLPFFGLAAVMSLLTVVEQQRHIAGIGHEWTLTLAERLRLAGLNLWFYAGKIVWPRELIFVYPRWDVPRIGWLPLAGAVAVAAGLWIMRRRDWARGAILGLGGFVALLLPVLGLVDVYYFRFSFVADHFQYLAAAALIALLVAGVTRWLPSRGARIVVAAAVLAVMGLTSRAYSPVYHDSLVLWSDTLQENPDSFLPQNNMGDLLFRAGHYQQALEHLQAAVRLQPRLWQARLSLANTLVKLNWLDEAAPEYQAAIQLLPRLYEAHYNLAVVLISVGRPDEAIDEFWRAIELKPGFADSYRRLGVLLISQGRFKEGLQTLRYGQLANPHDPGIAGELAWTLATCPDATSRNGWEAVQIAETICRESNDRQPDSLDTLAAADAEAGCFDDAVATARQALALAQQDHDAELAGPIASRLALYERGEPCRQGPGQ